MSDSMTLRVTRALSYEIAAQTRRLFDERQQSSVEESLTEQFVTGDSPAAVLEVGETLVAGLRFFRDEQQSLAVLDPEFYVTVGEEQRESWSRQLLSRVIQQAPLEQCRQVRILQAPRSESQHRWWWEILRSDGFSVRASVTIWQALAAWQPLATASAAPLKTESIDAIEFQQLPAISLQGDQNRLLEIVSLAERVASESVDLSKLPKPDAAMLVNDWSRRNAMLLMVRRLNRDLAFCVWTSQTSGGLTSSRLEFLGVDPDFRRQGLGTRLLRHVCRILVSGESLNSELTVFVDNENEPAMGCYEQAGFRRTSAEFDLWILDVASRLKASAIV